MANVAGTDINIAQVHVREPKLDAGHDRVVEEAVTRRLIVKTTSRTALTHIPEELTLYDGHQARVRVQARLQTKNTRGVFLGSVADELTLRADEVGTLKACINIDLMEYDRWRPPLVDADWHAFCPAIYKAIYKGANGKSCTLDQQGSRGQKAE